MKTIKAEAPFHVCVDSHLSDLDQPVLCVTIRHVASSFCLRHKAPSISRQDDAFGAFSFFRQFSLIKSIICPFTERLGIHCKPVVQFAGKSKAGSLRHATFPLCFNLQSEGGASMYCL
jgi:hypothetical protein